MNNGDETDGDGVGPQVSPPASTHEPGGTGPDAPTGSAAHTDGSEPAPFRVDRLDDGGTPGGKARRPLADLDAGDRATAEDHSAVTHRWVIRTPEGDHMDTTTRLTTSWPLLRMYSVRQVQLRYRQSLLGLSWTLVQPVAIMAIYGFIFTRVLDVSSQEIPYLSMAWSGLTVWMYVQATIQVGTVSLLNDAYMIGKVWFPREIIPLAPVLGGLVDLGMAAVVLIPILIVQGGSFGLPLLTLPLLLVVLLVWTSALTILAATITIFLRDMATIVGLVLRLAFIATPVMYPASLVTEQGLGWLVAANPFAVVIDNLRAVAIAGVWPNWELLALHGAIGTALLYISLKYLRSVERRMVDII